MISNIPFPSMTEASQLESGLWLWTNGLGGEDKILLKRLNSIMFASFEQRGICIAAAVWHLDLDNKLKFVNSAGSHVQYMSPQMSDDDRGERIWMYLEAECATLLLTAHFTADELSSTLKESLDVHRGDVTAIANELLGLDN